MEKKFPQLQLIEVNNFSLDTEAKELTKYSSLNIIFLSYKFYP